MEQLIKEAGGSTAAGHNPLWLERLVETLTIRAIFCAGVQERLVEKGLFFRRGEGDARIYLDGSGKAPLTC